MLECAVRHEGDYLGKRVEPVPPLRCRDWLAEAHLIARTAAGVGNPLDLSVEEFDRYLELSMSSNAAADPEASWHRRYVESQQ